MNNLSEDTKVRLLELAVQKAAQPEDITTWFEAFVTLCCNTYICHDRRD